MQRVDRIWFERGDWRSLSEDSLEKSLHSQSDDTDTKETTHAEQPTPLDQPPPGFDVMKLRESVVNKLL